MNICIIDDDSTFSNKFLILIKPLFTETFNNVNFEVVNNNFEKNILNKKYDIYFIDIELKESKGIGIAKSIHNQFPNSILIFISNCEDLVFQSLSAHPFQFIRKNNLKKDTGLVFYELVKYFNETMTLFTFDYYGRKTNIFQRDILYIESNKHFITIVTFSQEYSFRASLKDIIANNSLNNLVKIQKSIVINLMNVDSMDHDTVYMKDGSSFAIGRSLKEQAFKQYKEFILQ